MKTKSLLMITAAFVVMSTSAMANSTIIRTTHTVVKGPDIIVYTDKDGDISKTEWLSYQSQKFDETAAQNVEGKVYDEKNHAILKGDWTAYQSQKFDELDSRHIGKISRNEFDEEEGNITGPSVDVSDASSSRPRSENQAVSTSGIPSGADGAAGWTGQ